MGGRSGFKRFLVAASILCALGALVLAGLLFSGAVPSGTSGSGPLIVRTLVAAPLPPSPTAAPTSQGPALPSEGRAARRAPQPGPPIVQVGVIEIPRIGLVHAVFEGIQLRVIDRGPGHWPGTAMPGERGNAVFAGHRVTHSHPFLDIDLLVPGDRVIFRTSAGTSTYEVTEHLIVYPNDTWITRPTFGPTMTIFGCHPKHSARQRYVVRGQLVSFQQA